MIDIFKAVVGHPLSKRVVWALVVSTGVGLMVRPSLAVHLALTAGLYLLAHWGLSTPAERQALLESVVAFVREHWVSTMVWGLAIGVAAYGVASRATPAELAVQQVLSLVEGFGLLAVVLSPVLAQLLPTFLWGVPLSLPALGLQYLRGAIAYALAVWLIANTGDGVYRWVSEQPHEAAIMAAAVGIVWLIVRCCGGSSPRTGSGVRLPRASPFFDTGWTERDHRFIAAHEAGHALVYAALGGLPPGVRAIADERLDQHGEDELFAAVTAIHCGHRFPDRRFVEFGMLVHLAGKMGELRIMGEATLGSSDDYDRWVREAKCYLANHHRGMYYPVPQNALEQQVNDERLSALKAEQWALLGQMFDLNALLFSELADALRQKRRLSRDELIPFLARAELPSDFPRPFGPFEVFSDRWPPDRSPTDRTA